MSKARWRKARWVGLAVYCCVALLAATACGSDDDDDGSAGGGTTTTSSTEGMATEIGEPEGQVNLINWAGYVEKDWVTPFEKETGCKVNSKVGATSDEMVTLMKTGNYDGVSASGDATLRLIAGDDVAPVNTDLIENYDAVFEGLKNQPHNTVDGVSYGVPHGRGANLLMWRTDVVKPAPDSWSVVWDASSPYKGKITAYDSPIYIADAALYLKATQPDLGIEDPYELDDEQFQAAVDLLKQQKPNIGEYWSDAAKEIQSYTNKDTVVGTTWQYQANQLTGAKPPVPVKAIASDRGLDRLVGHLDDLLPGQEPELHVPLDELHHLAGGEREGDGVLRRGPGQRRGLRPDDRQEPLRDVPRAGRGLLLQGRVLENADQGLRRRPRHGLQGLRRVDRGLDRHQGLRGAP